MNSDVETPPAPQENPWDFRIWFCSLRRFPAQTSVTGIVTCSKSESICLKVRVMGVLTSL